MVFYMALRDDKRQCQGNVKISIRTQALEDSEKSVWQS